MGNDWPSHDTLRNDWTVFFEKMCHMTFGFSSYLLKSLENRENDVRMS